MTVLRGVEVGCEICAAGEKLALVADEMLMSCIQLSQRLSRNTPGRT
jgi:hypothetical protein